MKKVIVLSITTFLLLIFSVSCQGTVDKISLQDAELIRTNYDSNPTKAEKKTRELFVGSGESPWPIDCSDAPGTPEVAASKLYYCYRSIEKGRHNCRSQKFRWRKDVGGKWVEFNPQVITTGPDMLVRPPFGGEFEMKVKLTTNVRNMAGHVCYCLYEPRKENRFETQYMRTKVEVWFKEQNSGEYVIIDKYLGGHTRRHIAYQLKYRVMGVVWRNIPPMALGFVGFFPRFPIALDICPCVLEPDSGHRLFWVQPSTLNRGSRPPVPEGDYCENPVDDMREWVDEITITSRDVLDALEFEGIRWDTAVLVLDRIHVTPSIRMMHIRDKDDPQIAGWEISKMWLDMEVEVKNGLILRDD